MAKSKIIKKNTENLSVKGYQEVLKDIKSLLDKAKQRAYKAVDNIRVQTYWQIGERIVRAELEHKERADYGRKIIEELAGDIGLQKRLLFVIVQFYRVYPIVHALHAQLSWMHYTILVRISDKKPRLFYEVQAIQNAWSYRELERQMKSGLYEHILKEGKLTIPVSKALEPIDPEMVFKDIYNFDFLGIPENHREEELKTALLNKLEDFLREFGSEFFVGRREVPILIGGNYDRVDLELFHAGLLCYVLVEIKTEKFKHSHTSQMYSYLNWYKENKVRPGQKPPIGLIICKSKDDETVHYALGDLKKEIFVAEYTTELPTEDEIMKELE